MKKYKDILLEGFKQRRFELIQIHDSTEKLPWWIEEMWQMNGLKSGFRIEDLIITFLTNSSWENGPKSVEDISLTSKKMTSYLDTEFEINRLDMRKGDFENKLEHFWNEFDEKFKTITNND